MTDVFAEGGEDAGKLATLDEVLSTVVSDFSREVRAELATKLGPSRVPLGRTAQRLALDDISVARPILEHSMTLSEDDLLAVVAQKTQEHLLAVTRRADITEKVSHALVEKGDDEVVVSLLENSQAQIGRATYEAVTELAHGRPALHRPMVRRDGVPLELLNEIYLEVEANLRHEILARYDSVSPEELEAALQRGRARLARTQRRTALETAKLRAQVEEYRRRGQLEPPLLIRLLREGENSRALFHAAFAAITDVDEATIEKVTEQADLDGLALLCRAADFPRAIFVTLAISLVGTDRRMSRVEEFGALYEDVPVSAAQRAVRFWKVRATAA